MECVIVTLLDELRGKEGIKEFRYYYYFYLSLCISIVIRGLNPNPTPSHMAVDGTSRLKYIEQSHCWFCVYKFELQLYLG